MNGILISLKASCPGALRKSVLSLHRLKNPEEANKTDTFLVPLSSLPQGRAIITSKRRLLADVSPDLSSLLRRAQKNRASMSHPSPALTYSKPTRMDLLQGIQEMVCKLSDPLPCVSHHLPYGFLLWCKPLKVSLSGALLGAWHTLGAQYMFVG